MGCVALVGCVVGVRGGLGGVVWCAYAG